MLTELLTGGKEVIVTVCAMIGAFVAWSGVNTWRKQLAAQHTHKIAFDLLTAVYHLKRQIDRFRNPMFTGDEMGSALQHFGVDLDNMKQSSFLKEGKEPRSFAVGMLL